LYIKQKRYKILGFFSLVSTTLLWGTSFAFIKLSVGLINTLTYTFTRTTLASLTLLPIILYRVLARGIDYKSLWYGFIVGLTYSTGLALQGAGTAYIEPSMSAFITGLATIHVHLYSALIKKKYSWLDLTALVSAIIGLYVLTSPSGGLGLGGVLVFAGSIMWALQIILISRYGYSSIVEFLFGTFIAGVLYGPPALLAGLDLTLEAWIYISYLAIVCSIGATFFQVLGQRYISESTAAIVFLLEPVFATIFSILMGIEYITVYKVVGGGLILLSLYISTISELKSHSEKHSK
jgi:drug/metabolite transporter (DMT)-like permease